MNRRSRDAEEAIGECDGIEESACEADTSTSCGSEVCISCLAVEYWEIPETWENACQTDGATWAREALGGTPDRMASMPEVDGEGIP